MNSNETRTLWISVFAALFAVFLLYSHSQEKQAQLNEKFGASQTVVVAKVNIAEMETILDDQIELQQRPKTFMEPGAITNPDLIIGQIAGKPIKQGEQILDTKLLEPGPFTGVALQVSPGKRAVALPIDESRGVSKLLRPGDRIDLVAALDIGKGQNLRREVKTIMQDVVVLSTGEKITNNIPRVLRDGPDGPRNENITLNKFSTITVETTPRDAQDLIYILSTSPGSLFLTLRNPNDRVTRSLANSSVDTVLGRASQAVLSKNLRVPTSTPKYTPPAATEAPKKKKNKRFIEL